MQDINFLSCCLIYFAQTQKDKKLLCNLILSNQILFYIFLHVAASEKVTVQFLLLLLNLLCCGGLFPVVQSRPNLDFIDLLLLVSLDLSDFWREAQSPSMPSLVMVLRPGSLFIIF